MEEGLVSIITPCYNVDSVIHRYLDSVLNQTYKNIELILVNDGSVDNTADIIKSYEKKFYNRGISLIYIYQENLGLGGAINKGLKYFSGNYLCWADPDDFLEKESIEERVLFLNSNPQFACVTSDANVYNEDDLCNPIYKISDVSKYNEDENQFEHCLKYESIFCCGCHMIRSKEFLLVNPEREILPARLGQNWQMLLPIYYKYKRGFLDKPLYNYIIYKNSMSNLDTTKEKKINRYEEHLKIIESVLESINLNKREKKKYYRMYYKIYLVKKFDIYIEYSDLNSALKEYLSMLRYRAVRKYDTKSIIKLIIESFY